MFNFLLQLLGRGGQKDSQSELKYADRFTAPQKKFLEEDILRGLRPEQPCWADVQMRTHALEVTARHFGDDWDWSVQFLLSIYFLNPDSMAQIDQVVLEHVESRSGMFDPKLYAGRGWNPAEVMNYREDKDVYWRIYRSYAPDRWNSFEILRNPTTNDDKLTPSGLAYSGERGCVRNITLSRQVDVQDTQSCTGAFIQETEKIVSKALPDSDSSQLLRAIAAGEQIEISIGDTRVAYALHVVPPDWTINAGIKHEFHLTLSHN